MNSAEAIATGQDVVVNPDGSAEAKGIDIPGLPEGVVAVAYRVPKSGEFALGTRNELSRLNESWKWPALIVKPAPGWEFRYSVTENCYRRVRPWVTAKRIIGHFLVTDSQEEEAVRALKSTPGFDRFEEEPYEE